MPIRIIWCWCSSENPHSAPRWERYEDERAVYWQNKHAVYWEDYSDDSDDLRDSADYEDAILQTTGDFYGNPITIEILDHFLDLPLCKSAVVKSLNGSMGGRVLYRPRQNPEEREFDILYMWNMHRALERWLMGDRDVELPQGLSVY